MIPSKKIWASPQTPKGRETKRQRDKETKRQRDKETKRQRDKETKRQRDKETKKQRDKETKIQGAISVRPTRKPRLSIRWPVPLESRAAERRTSGEKFQEPPRSIWLLQSPPSIQAEPSVGASS